MFTVLDCNSLEDGATRVDTLFYNIKLANIVDTSLVPAFRYATEKNYQNNNGNPPYNTNPYSVVTDVSRKMYKLDGSIDNRIGLGITLKVMSGDNVHIYGKSYWHNTAGGSPANTSNFGAEDILVLLAGSNAITAAGKGATSVALSGSSAITGALGHWVSDSVPTESGRPKAYYNWILFDEQFRIVTGSSGFWKVGDADILKYDSATVDILKNGFLYVYCSNESNKEVFFDNLQVIHNKGPLLEETHYYPFGLTMSGISSKAAGKLENRYKYNGNKLESGEFSDGSGLEVYDFNARTYEQQIGRFMQIDPIPEEGGQESLTPYHFSGNNPSTFNDPNGKCPWCWGAIVGAAVEYATQVSANLIQGKSLGESLTDVNVGNIAIAAGAGALTGGVSAFVPKGAVKQVAVVAIGAVESASQQYNETGEVSLKKTLTDVGANMLGDKLTKNVKVNSNATVKTTEKQLDRATRIAAGDAASSGRAETVKKLEGKVSAQKATNMVGRETASGSTANATQAIVDNARGAATNAPPAPTSLSSQSKPAVDNTNIKRPVIWPGPH